VTVVAFDPAKHPRHPAGAPGSTGGEFAPKGAPGFVDREGNVQPIRRLPPGEFDPDGPVKFWPEKIGRGLPIGKGSGGAAWKAWVDPKSGKELAFWFVTDMGAPHHLDMAHALGITPPSMDEVLVGPLRVSGFGPSTDMGWMASYFANDLGVKKDEMMRLEGTGNKLHSLIMDAVEEVPKRHKKDIKDANIISVAPAMAASALLDDERLLKAVERLQRQYEKVYRRAARRAAVDYKAASVVVQAAGGPLPEEVVKAAALVESFLRLTGVARRELLREILNALLIIYGLNAEERAAELKAIAEYSKLLEQQVGVQAERLVAGVQDAAANVMLDSLHEGWSIPQTAKALTEKIDGIAPWQATMLARTDLIALANGASQQRAVVVNSPELQFKTWLATPDERTRMDHRHAHGQTVPISQPFTVGGEQLLYPGDPSASDGNVINCRCTLIYGKDAFGPPGIKQIVMKGDLAVSAAGYDPTQPRDPGGEGGGQWVKTGAGTDAPRGFPPGEFTPEDSVKFWPEKMGAYSGFQQDAPYGPFWKALIDADTGEEKAFWFVNVNGSPHHFHMIDALGLPKDRAFYFLPSGYGEVVSSINYVKQDPYAIVERHRRDIRDANAMLPENQQDRALAAAAWDETKHPRHPKGSDEGGEFRKGTISGDIRSGLGEYLKTKGVYDPWGTADRIMPLGKPFFITEIHPLRTNVKYGHVTSFKADATVRHPGTVANPFTGQDEPADFGGDFFVTIEYKAPLPRKAGGPMPKTKTTITEKPREQRATHKTGPSGLDASAFVEGQHPRHPAGTDKGGEFAPKFIGQSRPLGAQLEKEIQRQRAERAKTYGQGRMPDHFPMGIFEPKDSVKFWPNRMGTLHGEPVWKAITDHAGNELAFWFVDKYGKPHHSHMTAALGLPVGDVNFGNKIMAGHGMTPNDYDDEEIAKQVAARHRKDIRDAQEIVEGGLAAAVWVEVELREEDIVGVLTAAGWDPAKHPRHPAGSPEGGEFAPKGFYHGAMIARDENDKPIGYQAFRMDRDVPGKHEGRTLAGPVRETYQEAAEDARQAQDAESGAENAAGAQVDWSTAEKEFRDWSEGMRPYYTEAEGYPVGYFEGLQEEAWGTYQDWVNRELPKLQARLNGAQVAGLKITPQLNPQTDGDMDVALDPERAADSGPDFEVTLPAAEGGMEPSFTVWTYPEGANKRHETDEDWFEQPEGVQVEEVLDITDTDFFPDGPDSDLAGDYARAVDAARGLPDEPGFVTIYRGMSDTEYDAWLEGDEIPTGKWFAGIPTAQFAQDINREPPTLRSFRIPRHMLMQTGEHEFQLKKKARLRNGAIEPADTVRASAGTEIRDAALALVEALSAAGYNPAQPRDPGGEHGGQWVDWVAVREQQSAEAVKRKEEEPHTRPEGEKFDEDRLLAVMEQNVEEASGGVKIPTGDYWKPENREARAEQLKHRKAYYTKVTQRLADRLEGDPDFAELPEIFALEVGDESDRYMPFGTTLEKVQALHQGWANGQDTFTAMAIKDAVADEFGLDKPAAMLAKDRWRNNSYYSQMGPAYGHPGLRKFVRAVYGETQAELDRLGIDQLTLYRGDTTRQPEGLWPASATALRRETADDYAKGMSNWYGKPADGVVRKMVTPASNVWSLPWTGIGEPESEEVILVGDRDLKEQPVRAAAFVEADHPRHPKGSERGGEFRAKNGSEVSEDPFNLRELLRLPDPGERSTGPMQRGEVRSVLDKLVISGPDIVEPVLEAAKTIDQTMHWPAVPGEPGLKVGPGQKGKANQGVFWRYEGTMKPDRITLAPDGVNPISSATHELGHYLDSLLGQDAWADPKYVGSEKGRENWFNYSSSDPYGTLAPVVTAIKETDMYRGLAGGMQGAEFQYGGRYFRPGPRHVQYLMNPEEMVARSFEQYIAAKNPGSKIARTTRHAFSQETNLFPPEYPGYLKGKDLENVNAAWDRVLEERGLLKVPAGVAKPKVSDAAAEVYAERERKLKQMQTS